LARLEHSLPGRRYLAPLIIGVGTEAVGPLGVHRVVDGIRLVHRSMYSAGDDVLLAADVAP